MLGSPLGCFLALRGVDQARGAALGSVASARLMQVERWGWGTAGGTLQGAGCGTTACTSG